MHLTLLMKRISRYLRPEILEVLNGSKMVFVGGPRQVGKTEMTLSLLGPKATELHPGYYNWDSSRSRQIVKSEMFPVK